jgi:hypothetical protein
MLSQSAPGYRSAPVSPVDPGASTNNFAAGSTPLRATATDSTTATSAAPVNKTD